LSVGGHDINEERAVMNQFCIELFLSEDFNQPRSSKTATRKLPSQTIIE
jgi:hypothetical protein